jgi:hypothetical protein
MQQATALVALQSHANMPQNDSMLVVVGTGMAVTGLCSIPAATSLVLQLTRKEKNDNRIYEDGDGKATPESMKAFWAKPAKALILLFAAVGAALSIVLPVCSTGGESLVVENWMSMAAWVCLQSQTKEQTP